MKSQRGAVLKKVHTVYAFKAVFLFIFPFWRAQSAVRKRKRCRLFFVCPFKKISKFDNFFHKSVDKIIFVCYTICAQRYLYIV